MFLNVIQMAEDRASAAAMVKKKTEKLLVLVVCEQNMAGKEVFGSRPAEER